MSSPWDRGRIVRRFADEPVRIDGNGGDDDDDRRLVGIDLGIASAHTVRVLDGEGTTFAKRKAWPTVESLTEIESAALDGHPAGTRLEVVIEPTGPAWLPIAVFFIGRGHVVYRVSSAESADLRRYLVPARQDQRHRRRHAGADPVVPPCGRAAARAAGRGRGRVGSAGPGRDRLTRGIAERKTRIKALVRQLMPMTPLTGR